MSKIIIIGAGAMGSAFALPCVDNQHDISIVGTHLENDFIDNLFTPFLIEKFLLIILAFIIGLYPCLFTKQNL